MENRTVILESVSFSYSTDHGILKVLDNICLSISKGEHIGIIGESGSGKSTLLKLISGLYAPSAGKLCVCGACRKEQIRRHTAVVLQSPMLLPVSIHDNITCGHDIEDAVVKNACEAAQLTKWINSLPDGINTYVGERGSLVSGGQAQRISIARAIAKDAPVVLLDEPASALDGETGSAMTAALYELTKSRTVIHITHQTNYLHGCSKVYRLSGGKLYVE